MVPTYHYGIDAPQPGGDPSLHAVARGNAMKTMHRLVIGAASSLALVLSLSSPSSAATWQCVATLSSPNSPNRFAVPPWTMSNSDPFSNQANWDQACRNKLTMDWLGNGQIFKRLGLSPQQQGGICNAHGGQINAAGSG